MQKLIIIGNLGNDAEVRDLGTTQVINFSVAVTEKIKEENKTTWYKCAWFTNNVGLAPWLTKGSVVAVEGKPDIESYVAQDNTTKSNLKLIVRELKLVSSTKERTTQQPAQQNTNGPREAFKAAATPQAPKEEDHDDLPF